MSSGKTEAARLVEIYEGLPAEAREILLAFAAFLVERHPPATARPAEPQDIPRPECESVIKAIRRLSATYPMLDSSAMLNETSLLMSQHIIQGRAAEEIIDELEDLFRGAYDRLHDERP